MTRWLMAALFAWAVCIAPHALAQSGWRVQHFALQLEPHFETRSFTGTLAMDFLVQDSTLRHLDLDAGDLHMARVQLGAAGLAFERNARQLRVFLPKGLATGTPMQLKIVYEGKASGGLRFDADTQQVATAFSTSLWMPCLDDPAVRASFALTLSLPSELVSAGNGDRVGHPDRAGLLTRHVWQLNTPMPSYLYGFAAGRFAQARQMAGDIPLEYFGTEPFTAQSLQQVFADTADMLAFYADKAGMPYPLPAYRQVLLSGPAAQEMAGFSVMGARYGTRVLANPQAIWLGAHEAAHQWWGNGLTNRSLVFPDWDAPTAADFQRAMESSSGLDLQAFFKRWVYLQNE